MAAANDDSDSGSSVADADPVTTQFRKYRVHDA
jgi:hypothetical protein